MIRRLFNLSLIAAAVGAAAPAHAETKLLFNIFVPPSHFSQQVMRDYMPDQHRELFTRTAATERRRHAQGGRAGGGHRGHRRNRRRCLARPWQRRRRIELQRRGRLRRRGPR